jgi:predicted DNA-binding protein with PD1-like motif
MVFVFKEQKQTAIKTMRIFFHFIFHLCVTGGIVAQESLPARYTKVPSGYLMVLRQGDNLFAQLEALAQAEHIPSANFTGMGFAEVEFGFFNFKTKTYKPKRFKAAELAAMQGSIAWQNGKPSIHAHGLIADKKFKAYGGHILSATVGTGSLEILVTVHDKTLERKKDETLGANILCLDACN